MEEVLQEILQWYLAKSAPDSNHTSYFRCPVCGCTWHKEGMFSVARHNFGCWVPALERAAEHRVQADKCRVCDGTGTIYLLSGHPRKCIACNGRGTCR